MLGFGYQYKPKPPKPATAVPPRGRVDEGQRELMKARSAAPVILTVGALLLTLGMALGAFGPWAKVLTISVGGTDGSNDGWLIVGAALISLCFLLPYAFYRGASRWLMLGPLVAGVAGAAVAIYDRGNISNKISQAGAFGRIVQVGWGLNLAMVASILLAIVALIAVVSVTRPDAPFLPTSPQPATPTVGELERLSQLHESGSLTAEEFEAAKAQLLKR